MSLVRWWKLDGNAYDSSPNRSHGTVMGTPGVTYDSTYGKIGQGANFVSSRNSYITIPQVDITTHHSLSFWMYGNSEASANGSFLMGELNTTTNYLFAQDGSGFGYSDDTDNGSWVGDSDFFQKWRHVVVLFKTSTIELFLDGVDQESPGTYDGTFTLNNIGTGHVVPTSFLDFNGYLNDVRLYDNIISTKEIKALAQAKVLHWQFSHERNDTGQLILDGSGYERNATLDANAPTWSSNTGAGVGCYDFDNKYIEINSTDFPVKFGDAITISFLVNFNNVLSLSSEVLIHGTTSGLLTVSYVLSTYKSGANQRMRWSINNDILDDFNTGMVSDTWYHVCATYDGSNCNVYINGVEKAGNFARSGIITSQNGLKIGLNGGGGFPFEGKMTDVKIYNKGFTSTEAIALYQTSAQLDSKGNLWC